MSLYWLFCIELALELANRCPAARDPECVAGLRPLFADGCVEGAPTLELTALIKTDGQAVAANCLSAALGEPIDWQEIWWIEAEAGREYDLDVTVVGGDSQLDRFEPTLVVRVDRDVRKELAVALSFSIAGAGSLGTIGLIVLVSGLVLRQLRPKR